MNKSYSQKWETRKFEEDNGGITSDSSSSLLLVIFIRLYMDSL